MGRLLVAASAGALLGCTAAAGADFDGTIDVRGIESSGLTSYLNGGLGELRFDDEHDGLRIGELRAGYRDEFADIVHVDVEAVSYADHDRSPIDLTEAFAELRPYPHSAWRSRLKLGAFYAPISLENRMAGWRSPYSIDPSAINTWVGEELRTIGAEYDLDWLGRQRGHDWELGLTAATFGWNDTSGRLLALRGWAIDDRQTTLFGRVGERNDGLVDGFREFYAIDHRPGYYVGASAKYLDELELRALHYDNRADPSVYSSPQADYAWHTYFDSTGARWTPTPMWTFVSQWMGGTTCAGTDPYCWRYHAAFVLASWQYSLNRLSARYDGFGVYKTNMEDFYTYNNGHAWTLAYERELSRHFTVALEELQIDSRLLTRAFVGEPIGAQERELQLAVRCEL